MAKKKRRRRPPVVAVRVSSGTTAPRPRAPAAVLPQPPQPSRGGRVGAVFAVRISDADRERIEQLRASSGNTGPGPLGPWLVWRALDVGVIPARGKGRALEPVLPARAVSRRIVLDLCGGSGAWSRPYVDAGYDVRLVTLPDLDVRTYRPPAGVWGVLAAPPCTEFSLAKNGQPRDLLTALETVTACLRIIAEARPRWWALENPAGLLSRFLGRPRDAFQPHDFGDEWTKRTSLWGVFEKPRRAHSRPKTRMRGNTGAQRAVTPPGFARAFFKANP